MDSQEKNEVGPGSATAAVSTGHTLHDSSVTFEEYLYWAKLSRADERYEDPVQDYMLFNKTLKKRSSHTQASNDNPPGVVAPTAHSSSEEEVQTAGTSEKEGTPTVGRSQVMNVTSEEYVTASRALRTAKWSAIFYLIVTDILGPYSTPWAFAAMVYGPGIILYTIFGALAGYAGFLLWKMYLAMDSDRYPLQNYSDFAFRLYGSVVRQCFNVLQSLQLLFNVGIIIVANGLSLAQISNGSVCFIILCFVWAIAGMLFGQIRTLQKLGWLANLAIWMNLLVIFVTMAITSRGGVQSEAAINANTQFHINEGDPISTTSGARPGLDFSTSITGLMQAVYSYGGATLFVEFMAEMRRPFDFWKALIFAQLFIYILYVVFGIVVYSFQGQYSINPAYQGIADAGWNIATNAIGIITYLIAALLYGNIGIKVLYNNVLMDLFRFPSLGTRKGKILWTVVVPIYWGLAFILATAIPQISNLSGLVAAACILQFSYTFPPLLYVGFNIKRDAMLPGDGYDPSSGRTIKGDKGLKRMWRGYRKHWMLNTFNIIFVLGSVVTAILGIYSAILGVIEAYASGASTSFSCANPYA